MSEDTTTTSVDDAAVEPSYGGDDALRALTEIMFDGVNRPSASAILAAIRDGKVPTVYCYKTDFHDLWQAAEKDLSALRARCEALERDLTSNVALVKSEVKNAQRAEAERDAAIAAKERAEAERDAAIAIAKGYAKQVNDFLENTNA